MADHPVPEKPRFRFEPLDKKKHDRAAFSCGQESLDRYLKEHATQEIKKRVAAVYVLTPDGKTIAGYYTLSQYAIEAGELPPELIRQLHLPRYDKLPATLLGRLARNKDFKGRGVGELLLMVALKMALEHSRNIASVAVVVDAIDEHARAFYRRYGFIDIPNRPNRLFMPMRTVGQIFPDVGTEEVLHSS
ncbi:MAG: GNAT family N-acetyltransferase [Terriglobales bacterium]